MIRYTFIALAILATAATAIASVHTKLSSVTGIHSNVNTTVVGKTSPFPVVGPIIVETCAVEDCSDS